MNENDRKVLLVVPEEQQRDFLTLFLKELEFTVEIAPTAMQAWNRLGREKFGLLICDRLLPDMDSLNFIRNVRKVYPMLLIALTADYGCTLQFMQQAWIAGVNECLVKPLSQRQITESMIRIYQRHAQTGMVTGF